MTEDDVVELFAVIQSNWTEAVSMESGDDDGRYINLFIESDDPLETWTRLKDSFIDSKLPGRELAPAMIATITGNNGWDDYLLLHHFDSDEPLDTLPEMAG